jgi:hypothetical protein
MVKLGPYLYCDDRPPRRRQRVLFRRVDCCFGRLRLRLIWGFWIGRPGFRKVLEGGLGGRMMVHVCAFVYEVCANGNV